MEDDQMEAKRVDSDDHRRERRMLYYVDVDC